MSYNATHLTSRTTWPVDVFNLLIGWICLRGMFD